MKAFAKFIARLLLVLFVAVVLCFAYLNVFGFPSFLKDVVVKELARSGYAARFNSIRLDWIRGVIATDATLADAKVPDQVLARIDEVQLHWNWSRWMQQKNPIDALRIANATVSVPTPADEIGPQQFSASSAYATVKIGDDGTIHIDQLTGVYCGIALHVTGRVKPRTTAAVGAPKKPATGKAQFAFVTKALRELNSLQVSSPPQLDLDFDFDLGDPMAGQAKVRLHASAFVYRKLLVDSAAVDVQMRNGAIEFGECLLKVNSGRLSITGRYDILEGLFDLHLESTIDPSALAAAIPPQAQKVLSEVRFQKSPRISAHYILSPETGSLPQLRGSIQTGGLEIRNVRFRSIKFDFFNEGPQITISNATIVTAEGQLTGQGQYHIESSDFTYVFDSTIDPRKLLPLMTPMMQQIVEPSWFDGPPHIVASVSGDFVDPDAFAYDAEVTAGMCRYRGVSLTGASAKLHLRHSKLEVHNIVLDRDEGELRGELTADFNRHRVYFDVATTANPSEMAPLLGPKAAQIMHPYRFGQQTEASAQGVVDFDHPADTTWAAKVSNEGFSYWKFTADHAQADLTMSNNVFRIANFDSDFYDGKLQGEAVFGITNSVTYQFGLDADHCDVQKILTAIHADGRKSRVTGLAHRPHGADGTRQ